MTIVVMGVSGSGKSTLGSEIARQIGWKFFDGDDFHPAANIEKMSAGIPLNDTDREPWLLELAELMKREPNIVLACSALKESYRGILKQGGEVEFVFLNPSSETLQRRLEERPGHFMKAGLLDSQLSTLEPPRDALLMDGLQASSEMAADIIKQLGIVDART